MGNRSRTAESGMGGALIAIVACAIGVLVIAGLIIRFI